VSGGPGLRLNFALVPPAVAEANLVQAASQIAADSVRSFAIDGTVRRAHLTIFMTHVTNAASAEGMHRALVDVRRDYQAEELRAVAFSVSANGYVEVAYEKSDGLIRLQAALVAALPQRAETRVVGESHLSHGERANLRCFGYEFVGDQFRPHVTLARFDPRARISVPPLDRAALSFTAERLTLLVADEEGCAGPEFVAKP
jgi:2'-5' RNA ligase